jgi:(1->4)-alpha-D-glucan 1-alpha-D-glucosylmutase
MYVMTKALSVRLDRRELFEQGDYVPLRPIGTRRDSIFAFARWQGADHVITCVPRLIGSLIPDATSPPTGSDVWGDTKIELPDERPRSGAYLNVFTGARMEPELIDGRATLPASVVFDRFPTALLVPCST